jgi:glycosyltransferase involved in cell wall biosynthesis
VKKETDVNSMDPSQLRVCVLGSYRGRIDEGMANVSYHVYENLMLIYPKLSLLDIGKVWTWGFWREMNRLNPDLLYFVPGPTLKGLVLAKLLQILTHSTLIVSATKPVLPKFFKKICRFLRPDLVIVQSPKSEKIFGDVGYKTIFIPNGVNTDRFAPVTPMKKTNLRKQYGFEENDFVVLHVGPLKKGRNQSALLRLKDEKVILVTSISNPSEKELVDQVSMHENITVWSRYFENIEEVYAIADVYVFPVFEELNSIDIPLSVLEAMSCNLPVIATNYGGLSKIVKEGDGFFYMRDEEELYTICQEIRSGNIRSNTRQKVEPYSWKSITRMISDTFQALYGESIE